MTDVARVSTVAGNTGGTEGVVDRAGALAGISVVGMADSMLHGKAKLTNWALASSDRVTDDDRADAVSATRKNVGETVDLAGVR